MSNDLAVYQPELFEGAWPVQPELEAKAKEYLHTGKIACKDAERVEQVCRAVLLRIPARAIARKYKIGRETIDAIVAHAHATGKLRPLAEALLEEATEIAFLAGHALKEALADGKVQPQCLGMVWGTATDKIQLLTHQATSIVLHKEGDDNEALIRLAWEAVQRARAASDPEAGAKAAQVVDITTLPASQALPDTALDTAQAAGAVTPAAEPSASEATSPTTSAAQADGGGGGYDFAAPSR
jgi:hypothetical protein